MRCEDSEKIEDVGDVGLEPRRLKERVKAELDRGVDGFKEAEVG